MKPIYIESPCPASLANMKQLEAGFFCKSCDKCVVDCRGLSTEELQKLPENSCGIFNADDVSLPSYSIWKAVAFKSLIVLSIVGFNVKPLSAQTNSGTDTEKVEILREDGSPTGKFEEKTKTCDKVEKPKRRHLRLFRRRRRVMGKFASTNF